MDSIHFDFDQGANVALLMFAAVMSFLPARAQAPKEQRTTGDRSATLPATPESYRRLAAETETMLHHDVLDPWYPRAMDEEHGGFYADFDRKWRPLPSHGKFSVFQARMTWTAATVAIRRPNLRAQYLPYMRHGLSYLENTLWDKQYGGFLWGLADDGRPSPQYGDGKHLYGISFCVYALSAAYKADPDPKTLAFAQQAFAWIEEHAHDDVNDGYYEWLTREGKPMLVPPYQAELEFRYGADSPVGYKSMNTHIHMLEAYTELYGVWKDERVRRRVDELLTIVRDRIAVQPGAMNLYFTPDWRPIPGHDSYGHDVETTYLMDEAATSLGRSSDPKTRAVGRMMVDHALSYGWDKAEGGLFESGAAFGKPGDLLKEWWVQMESLNALLLMHELYGAQNPRYWEAFQQQWTWVRTHQVDAEFGGEYNQIKPDGQPVSPVKGSPWKASYHESRALLNVNDRLRALAGSAR